MSATPSLVETLDNKVRTKFLTSFTAFSARPFPRESATADSSSRTVTPSGRTRAAAASFRLRMAGSWSLRTSTSFAPTPTISAARRPVAKSSSPFLGTTLEEIQRLGNSLVTKIGAVSSPVSSGRLSFR